MSAWKNRPISLAGKIAIIKSLVTSKLTYCQSVLASPNQEYWKEIETLLYNFINNGQTDKIKRNTLIGAVEDGGFKMIDVQSQNTAAKIRWMTRLINNEGIWKEYILQKIKMEPIKLLRCNIKYEDLPFKFNKDSLWDEVWQKWCGINYEDNIEDEERILNQHIWYNSHIKINHKVVWKEKWSKQGISWMTDLIMEDDRRHRRFKTIEEITAKLGFQISHLEYRGLLHSIPSEWKKKIFNNNDREQEEDEEQDDYKLIDRMLDSATPAKLIYNMLVKKKTVMPSIALMKWKRDLNLMVEDSTLIKQSMFQGKLTQNNKIRSFNYKFLLRSVPYESRLHKMTIKPSPLCQNCNVEESLLHLYWDCPRTKRLWERLKTITEEYQHTVFVLDKQKCLTGLGNWISKNNKERLQTLCVLTKYYIHLSKCDDNNKNATSYGLEQYLKRTLRIEYIIAQEKGLHNMFIQRWDPWIHWINS